MNNDQFKDKTVEELKVFVQGAKLLQNIYAVVGVFIILVALILSNIFISLIASFVVVTMGKMSANLDLTRAMLVEAISSKSDK